MIECTKLVNSWFNSNTYILAHKAYPDVWVIDPGDIQPIFKWMKSNNKTKVTGILLTHAHFDHIYGINPILLQYPNCVIYVANEIGKELLHDAKKNSSYYSEMESVSIYQDADVRHYEGDMILWPKVKMEIIHTPGHSEDSVCLILNEMLFTGDTLIKDTRTVTKLRGGSVEKLEETIALLKSYKGKGLYIYPGHGESFPFDHYDLIKMSR